MYQFKDHLGNIRLSYSDRDNDGKIDILRNNADVDGDNDYAHEILEENSYYPFGLKHRGYNSLITSTNKALDFKFNGIELEQSLGLNLYEMPLRQYDPTIARWTGIDPVTHHSMSTYTAFDNNPVFWADPSGANSEDFINDLWNQSGEGSTTWTNNNDGTFSNDDGAKVESGSCSDCTKCPETCGNTAQQAMSSGAVYHQYGGYALPKGGYNAAMRGGNPWKPTEDDAKAADEAVGQAVLFISGEWAAVKVLQGGAWVVRFIRAKNIARNARFVNLASEARTAHIIAGDATGGGHAWWGSLKSFWNGITGAKTMFPVSWGNKKIMHAISEIATSNPWIQQTGRAGATHTRNGALVRYKIEGVYEGVKMRVITTVDDIITAFPIQ